MAPQLLITVGIGIAGAWVFQKLRVPAGAMIGAIVSVALYQTLGGAVYFPRFVKTCVQALAGGFIGQRIARRDILELRTLIKPALELFLGIFCLSVCTGLLICVTTEIDIATALLSSIPGGLTDVALMSEDIGANPTQSTALQIIRYFIAILILPQINIHISRRFPDDALSAQGETAGRRASGRRTADLLRTLGIVAVSGLAGKLSGFPAGALVFPMFAVAACNVRYGGAYIPRKMKTAAQCLAGINIGVLFSVSDILQAGDLLIPAFLVALNCLLTNYLLSFLLHRTTGLGVPTCLFASVPAGVSDMALISLEQGGDPSKVAVLQLVRYVCVMAFMPAFIKVFASIFPF